MHWDSESYAESQAPYRGHSLPDPEAYSGVELCYDYDGKIYIQDRTSAPVWSLDGRWLVLQSPGGESAATNLRTLERKSFLPQEKILWGVHWSPDSRYIFVTEEIGLISGLA